MFDIFYPKQLAIDFLFPAGPRRWRQGVHFLLFSPNHFIDDADVRLDDLDDLVGDVFVGVVRDRNRAAVLFLTDHLNGDVDCLKQAFRVDAGEDEACLIKCFGTFCGGADADGGERVSDRGKERGFLWKRARIGHDTSGVHLEAVIIVKSERFVLDHAAVEFETGEFEAFSASGVAGIEDRHVVLFRHLIDRGE